MTAVIVAEKLCRKFIGTPPFRAMYIYMVTVIDHCDFRFISIRKVKKQTNITGCPACSDYKCSYSEMFVYNFHLKFMILSVKRSQRVVNLFNKIQWTLVAVSCSKLSTKSTLFGHLTLTLKFIILKRSNVVVFFFFD